MNQKSKGKKKQITHIATRRKHWYRERIVKVFQIDANSRKIQEKIKKNK